MPTLTILADTHGAHDRVKVPAGDILIHAGDWMSLTHDLAGTIAFLRWYQGQPHVHRVLIAGNHDVIAERAAPVFRALLAEHAPDVTYLQDSGVTIEGLRLWGSPVSPTFFDWSFNRDRGAPIRAHWDLIPDDTDVLITHGPPFGHLDRVQGSEGRAGCRDLYEAILRVRPKATCHGHLHLEGGQTTELVHDDGSKTTIVNAAICDEQYRPNRQPIVIEL